MMIHTCIAFLLLFFTPTIQAAQDYEKNHFKNLTHFSQEKFDFLTQNSDVLDRYWQVNYKYTDFWHGSVPKDVAATCSLALMQQYGIPKDVITRLLGAIASYDYTFYPEQLFLQKLHTQPVCISINQEINDHFYPKRMIRTLLPGGNKGCNLLTILPYYKFLTFEGHWYNTGESLATDKHNKDIINVTGIIYQPPKITDYMGFVSPYFCRQNGNPWIQSIKARYNEETSTYEYDVQLKNNTEECVKVHIISNIMTLEYSKKDTEGYYLEAKKVCIELPALPDNFKPFNFNFTPEDLNRTPEHREIIAAAACPISLSDDYIGMMIGEYAGDLSTFPMIISKHIMADLLKTDEPKLLPLAMVDVPVRSSVKRAARYFVGGNLAMIKFIIYVALRICAGVVVLYISLITLAAIVLFILEEKFHYKILKQ